MRWLYHFAVLAPRFGEGLARTFNASGSTNTNVNDHAVRYLEESVYTQTLLSNAAERIAYYGVSFNGWNATHEVIGHWILAHRPRAYAIWDELLRRQYILRPPSDEDVRSLLPAPSDGEVSELYANADFDDYGVEAFIRNLFVSLRFYVATSGYFLLTSRIVGCVQDDRHWDDGDDRP